MPPSPPLPAYLSGVIRQFEKFAAPQPTLLTVHLANVTAYYQDDLTMLATQPLVSLNPANLGKNFYPLEVIGDIVQINDDTKVKGLYLSKNLVTESSPTALPGTGTNIGDASIIGFRHDVFKILYPDPMQTAPTTMEIGCITAAGVSGKPVGPGGPSEVTGGDWAITGGTGAFLGVTGQMGGGGGGVIRATSVREDPSKRKVNASSSNIQTILLYVIPMMEPRIIEVFHAASANNLPTPVTPVNPARSGDRLILYATGLGPVRYQSGNAWVDVPIGQPFPASTTVISPVTVTVGNTPVLIAPQNAQGFQGSSNGYSVDFIVPVVPHFPPGPLPETTSIQISSAWIQSAVGALYVH